MKKRFSINYSKALKWYIFNFFVTKNKTLTCIFKSYLPWDKTFYLDFEFHYRPQNVDHTGVELILDLIFFGLDIEFFDRRHVEDYITSKNKKFEDKFIIDDFSNYCYRYLLKHDGVWYTENLTETSLKYDYVYNLDENYAHIMQDNKYGLIDKDYNTIIPPIYDEELEMLNGNLFVAKLDGKYGVIDTQNSLRLPFKYKDFRSCDSCDNKEVLIVATQQEKESYKYGVIDTAGNILIPFEYDTLWNYRKRKDTFIAGKGYQTKGIINLKNEVIIPFEKNCYIHELSDKTFIRVKCGFNNEYYIYDFSNKKVCNTKFSFIKNNSYDIDLFEATKDFENWGYIDKYGKTKIRFKYKETGEFENGYAQVALDMNRHNFGLINKKGKLILPFEYDYGFEPVDDGEMFIVIKNGKYGIVDRKNKVVIDCQYDYITKTNGCYLAKQNGKFGYFHEYFGSVLWKDFDS